MNIHRLFIILLTFLLLGVQDLRAQSDYVEPPLEKVQKPYRFNDNLFYGFSIGGAYSMSEYVKQEKGITMIRPNADFFFGKTFTKAIAARLSIGYHCQAASIGNDVLNTMYQYSGDNSLLEDGPVYSVHMANIGLDGMLCLNRIFGNRNQYPRVKLNLIAGGGLNIVLGYSPKTSNWTDYINQNRDIKLAPELHAGLQSAFRVSSHKTFDLQCTWHLSTKDYTGFTSQASMRHYVEFKIGFTNHLLNRYISYSFENCRGNEKYYFERNERILLEQYEKERKHAGKNNTTVMLPRALENDTILSFPHTYPYLTPYQTAKLEKMVNTLRERSDIQAVIDVYPYTTTNDDINFTQSVDRSKDVLSSTIEELWGSQSPAPVRYVDHIFENSPINPDGIWFHNAFIHYEKK